MSRSEAWNPNGEEKSKSRSFGKLTVPGTVLDRLRPIELVSQPTGWENFVPILGTYIS